MKKYIYKCDSCGHKWKDSNPEQCSRCSKEDFHIHAEVKGKKALIFSIVFLILAVSGGLAWYFSTVTPSTTTYIVSYDRTESGVIKVITEPKIDDFEKFNFSFKNLSTNSEVKRIDNNLYPCENGEIIFSFQNEDENIKIIEEQAIGLYNLKDGKYHPDSGCGEAPPQLMAKIDYKGHPTCTYILTVWDENKGIKDGKITEGLEMSWGSENNWKKNVFKKNFDQIKQPFSVSIRLKDDKNTIIQASPYEKVAKCKSTGCKPKCIDVVQGVFNKFKNTDMMDAESEADAFMNVCNCNKPNIQIVFKGSVYGSIDDFSIDMMSEEEGFENPASLSVVGVEYSNPGGCEDSGSKITQIIIK